MFNAGIGIFGQQVIPTLVMIFVAWPVLLTQIWGLVQQSKLDDKALAIAEDVVRNSSSASQQHPYSAPVTENKFCTQCGTKNSPDANFCSHCGNKL